MAAIAAGEKGGGGNPIAAMDWTDIGIEKRISCFYFCG